MHDRLPADLELARSGWDYFVRRLVELTGETPPGEQRHSEIGRGIPLPPAALRQLYAESRDELEA